MTHAGTKSLGINRAGALIAVLLSLALLGFGGPLVEKTADGNLLYGEENYDDALKMYTDAQLEDPESPELQYNIGNVFYRQGKYDQAMEQYQKSLHSERPEVQEQSWYNMGNALTQTGKLPEAVLAYKKALEIDPSDRDAKYNLEYVRKKLKEMAEKQKQQQEQSPQCDKDKQEQQQQEQQQQEAQQQEKGEQEKPEQDQQQQAEQEPDQAEEEQAQSQVQPQTVEGELSEEEAERILQALESSEKEAQKEQLSGRGSSGQGTGKDW